MNSSKGVCILAQNNSKTDYVRQAYALAKSLKKYNDVSVSIITNDNVEYDIFDNVIPIPWDDNSQESEWKIENRWKVYHCSPYEHTMVFDADMLVLQNIDHWWNFLEDKELYFVDKVKTYQNKQFTTRYYRKVFDSNNLPDLYSGIYYFKKGKLAQEFFQLVELIMFNWELFYGRFAGVDYQKWCSFDVSVAIASKLLDNCHAITNKRSPITFTHMKPRGQHWQQEPQKWTQVLDYYIRADGSLMVGNYKQSGVFHYVEDTFLNDTILGAI